MIKVVIFILVVIGGTSFAQTKNPPAQQPPKQEKVQEAQPQFDPFIDHFRKKRDLAIRWNDQATASDALFDLIVETGNDSLAYLLAIHYYETQQYAPCVLICKDLLSGNSKNTNYLQLSAMGFEALGLRDKALPNYESLYLLTDNTAVLYKMANLQYETKLDAECKANVEILLTKTDLDKLNVNVNIGDNKTKEYPLKVAILNLKGLVIGRGGDKPGAKKAFEAALALSPDFPMAKQNLEKLK